MVETPIVRKRFRENSLIGARQTWPPSRSSRSAWCASMKMVFGDLLLGETLGFFGALLHGAKRLSIHTFVALCAQEPECQPTRVMVCSRRFRSFSHIGTNSQRALPARLAPPSLLHDDADHHTDRLPQALCATWVFGGEKGVDGWLSLEFSNDPRQGRSVVMNLGLFHPTLPPRVIEKG